MKQGQGDNFSSPIRDDGRCLSACLSVWDDRDMVTGGRSDQRQATHAHTRMVL